MSHSPWNATDESSSVKLIGYSIINSSRTGHSKRVQLMKLSELKQSEYSSKIPELKVTDEDEDYLRFNIPQPSQRKRRKVVIIWSMIRSGSSFLGTLIQSIPGVYYNTEPIRTRQWQNFPNEKTDMRNMREFLFSLMKCNLNDRNFIGARQSLVLTKYLLDFCVPFYTDDQNVLCDKQWLLNFMCDRAQFQLLKIVSIELKEVLHFLADPELDVKIIHLLRDPRGSVTSSRLITIYNLHYLQEPDYFCSRIRKDVITAKYISKKYPNR